MYAKTLFLRLLRRMSVVDSASMPYAQFVQNISTVKIPENYHRDLFSKLVTPHTSPKSELQPQEQPERTSKQVKRVSGSSNNENFVISAEQYSNIVAEDPFGSMELFMHRDTSIAIAGMTYTHIPPQNIWKIMSIFKPDMVLLQVYPDDFQPGFKLNHRARGSSHFSEKDYVKGLTATAPALYSPEFYEKIIKNVKQEAHFKLTQEFKKLFFDTVSEGAKARAGLPDLISFDKLTDEIVATASVYCQNFEIPMLYSDIPDIVLKNKICIASGLTILKKMLDTATENIPKNPDFTPSTPINLGHLDFQQTLTTHSDVYTSNLIEYILKKQKPKRLLVLGGNLQGKTLRLMLENRTPTSIHDTIKVEDFQMSLFDAHYVEVLIEKLAVLDVLKHGASIITKKITRFPQSMALIEKYSGSGEGTTEYRYFFYLHQQLVKKYLDQFLKIYDKGIKELKNHLYQKVLELEQDKKVQELMAARRNGSANK